MAPRRRRWLPERRIPVLHVVLLLACAVTIYFICEWFVNAVEWLGVQLKVGPIAVGTILAAAGTALPESVVTLVAVLFGSAEHSNDIAVGAAMGGPLVVGTVAYGVTGAMLLWRRRTLRRGAPAMATGGGALALATDPAPSESGGVDADGRLVGVDTARLARDQRWFMAIFIFKVALGLVAFAVKPWLGLLFFAAYAVYFWREMRGTGEHASADDLEPLKLQPRRVTPTRAAVLIQVGATLALIFGASQLFVAQLASITYLLWLLRRNRLTAARLTCAAGFYVAFAVALAITL